MMLFILIYFSGNSYSQEFSKKEKDFLKVNSVKSRTSYSSEGKKTYQINYDRYGNTTEELSLDKNEDVEKKYSFSYDDDNNLVKEKRYVNGSLNQTVTYKSEVSSNGNLKRVKRYLDDEYDGYYTFEYDENNNLTVRKFYDKSGENYATYMYQYDSKDKLTGEDNIFIINNKTIKMIQKYKYDYNGNLKQNDWYVDGLDDKYTTTYKYTYFDD